MRPAQGAVAGIDVQVADLAAANHWQVGRCGGAQASPVLGTAYIGCTGEKLLHAPHDRLATRRVELAVVACQLGGARNPQAIFSAAISI